MSISTGSFDLYSRGDKFFGWAVTILLGLFVASTLYPFVYVLSASMSSGAAVARGDVVLMPKEVTFDAFRYVMADRQFWVAYGNTFYYTIVGTLTSLAFIIPGAYALSRPQLPFRSGFNLFVAFTLWFHAGMIPVFLNIRDLGILDTRFAIIIAFAVNAFNAILMRNFFESVPRSFEEAARMDGANDFQILWRVYMPLSKPAIITVGLFCAVFRWNGYFWAMVILRDQDKLPLQVYLKEIIVELNMSDEFATDLLSSSYSFETAIAAIIVLSIIPVIIVYPYIQKYFQKGVMLGGVKE